MNLGMKLSLGVLMMPARQQALFDAYPELFQNKKNSCSPISNGLSCGDGWYHILDQLCESLTQYTTEKGLPSVQIVQIKEKFGTLRFYVAGADPVCYGMIRLVENLSGKVCEDCGAPGALREDNWWKTRCEDCYNA
jgi:hypothetical protein